jgi:hypothetical protein
MKFCNICGAAQNAVQSQNIQQQQYAQPQQPQQYMPPLPQEQYVQQQQYTQMQETQQQEQYTQPTVKKSKAPLFAVIAAVVVIAGGIGAWFVFGGGGEGEESVPVGGTPGVSTSAATIAKTENDRPPITLSTVPPRETQEQGGGQTVPATLSPQNPSNPNAVLTAAQIFEKNKFAVVIIQGNVPGGVASGSGFIVCSTGIVVTNHHVMDGMTNATATLYDGREYAVTGFYSYDTSNDLAIIQLDGRGNSFQYVTLGDSDDVRVGDSVYAIGGPDWEPITFTDGMVSRFAYEAISFGRYSIAGMIQNTAAIYQGNSGGPLVNDKGDVIGINSAGHTQRASVQWAVPINRVVLPSSGAKLNSLPVGSTATPPQWTGRVTFLTRFPSVPDFLSVSRNASLLLSGTCSDLDMGLGDYYDYFYVYELPVGHILDDTDEFDEALEEHGFVFQEVVFYDEETWVYFYNRSRNLSVSYVFDLEHDIVIVAIGQGDVYETYYG